MCWNCSRNKELSKKDLEDNYQNPLGQANKIYKFLHEFKPKLSYKKAFHIIYFLQEDIGCLPDHIEQCQDCLDLFDCNKEGFYLSDDYKLNGRTLPKKYRGHWCDNCVPDVDFKCP